MNKKAILSAIIPKIVGGAIVVAIMMALFVGLSSPFLESMSDKENIVTFNKFTTGMGTACNVGVDTEVYMKLTKGKTSYFISAVGPKTSSYLQLLDRSIIGNNEKRNLEKCVEGDYCYCLIKAKEGSVELNKDQKAIVKEFYPDTEVTLAYSSSEKGSVCYSGTHSSSPANYLSQSFKPKLSGKTSEFKIKGFVDSTYSTDMYPYDPILNTVPSDEDIRVTLVEASDVGVPTSTVIATTRIKADELNSLIDNGKWITLDFKEVELSKEKTYAIVLKSSDDLSDYRFCWNGSEKHSSQGSVSFVVDATRKTTDYDKGTNIDSQRHLDFNVKMNLIGSEIAFFDTNKNSNKVFTGGSSQTLAQTFTTDREGSITKILIDAEWSTMSPDVQDSFTPVYISVYKINDQEDIKIEDSILLVEGEIPLKQLQDDTGTFSVVLDDEVFIYEDEIYVITLSSNTLPNGYAIWWYGGSTSTKELNAEKSYSASLTKDFSEYTNWDFGFTVSTNPASTKNILQEYDALLFDELSSKLSKLDSFDIVQCRALAKDLGCKTENFEYLTPTLKTQGSYYVITELQPGKSNLWFDSYSFNRPIKNNGEFENFILSHTEPEIYDDMYILKEDKITIFK